MHNGHLPGHVGIGDGAVAAGATHAAITVEDAWKKFFVKELAGRKLFVFGQQLLHETEMLGLHKPVRPSLFTFFNSIMHTLQPLLQTVDQ